MNEGIIEVEVISADIDVEVLESPSVSVPVVGIPGPRGKGWVFGDGPPINTVGANGDQYYDRESGIIYGPKSSGTWSEALTLNLRAEADEAKAATVAALAAADETQSDRLQTGLDRVATGQDRTATAADRATAVGAAQASINNAGATGQDADATALDRLATGQDKSATSADRVQVGQDRAATGQDRVATAADRVQTGQDLIATAAHRVTTGQDAVATASDRTQTGLDRAATGQDKTATAADRVQTGLDRAAAANSAASITPVNQQIVAATAKTAPDDADSFALVDTSASNSLKKLTWANIKTALATVFATVSHSHTVSQLSDATVNARSLLQSANYASMFGLLKQSATDTAAGVVELATNAETATGTDTDRAITPANLQSRVGVVANKILALDGAGKIPAVDGSLLTNLPASPGLGVGQTWQDVKASRSLNTSYQNLTSMPIQVFSVFSYAGYGSPIFYFQISYNNSTWITLWEMVGTAYNVPLSFIVPSGYYYKGVDGGTPTTINRWVELR